MSGSLGVLDEGVVSGTVGSFSDVVIGFSCAFLYGCSG
jgi:hypothetical protein